MQQCASGQEAFVTLLSALLEHVHHGLDGFEKRLGELEHAMRRRNRMNLMTAIFERRYDLLHWSHLFMPIKELNGAVKEAFVSLPLCGSEPFQRLQHKLERIESLLQSYASEIDTLISMDDAISSFRGNDIMKTLTIITVLFTPATVAGTLWGMNFINLPWASNEWGFIGNYLFVGMAQGLDRRPAEYPNYR
jgi:Mg2+ and Co2+ transporter CorA